MDDVTLQFVSTIPTTELPGSDPMSAMPQSYLSSAEYLAIERKAETKSEYFDGRRFAMAGGLEPHNSIAANTLSRFVVQFLGRPCKAYGSDQRIKVVATGLYTYPDISAACGDREFEDERRDTLLNPQVLVEVLSKGTERYDRGDKFEHYQRIASLQNYLMISQKKHHVDHDARQADGSWLLRVYTSLDDVVEISSVGCRLALREIYDKVELSDE
jgi:Uma2 family endonuclease